MSFLGGKLKLKGDAPLKASGAVKKKRKSKPSELAASGSGGIDQALESKASDTKQAIEGYSLASGAEVEDRRTAAEKTRDERMAILELERLKKLASKSHRNRVKEFNEQLANLSEHHDIPKVGPG